MTVKELKNLIAENLLNGMNRRIIIIKERINEVRHRPMEIIQDSW